MLAGRRRWLALLIAWFAARGAWAQAVPAAGKVTQALGTARLRSSDGRERDALVGSEVSIGDRITTGPDARYALLFNDGTRVFLGANSVFTVTAYLDLGPEPSFVATIAQGAFRMLTGAIARTRPRAIRLSSPVATVGIRGTHFGGEVTPTSATIVLLDPEEAGRRTAIEVANDFGAVTIDEPGFGTEIPDAKSPPSAPRRMRLRAVDNLLRSFSTIQRMR
jgi:hypothetical protein